MLGIDCRVPGGGPDCSTPRSSPEAGGVGLRGDEAPAAPGTPRPWVWRGLRGEAAPEGTLVCPDVSKGPGGTDGLPGECGCGQRVRGKATVTPGAGSLYQASATRCREESVKSRIRRMRAKEGGSSPIPMGWRSWCVLSPLPCPAQGLTARTPCVMHASAEVLVGSPRGRAGSSQSGAVSSGTRAPQGPRVPAGELAKSGQPAWNILISVLLFTRL